MNQAQTIHLDHINCVGSPLPTLLAIVEAGKTKNRNTPYFILAGAGDHKRDGAAGRPRDRCRIVVICVLMGNSDNVCRHFRQPEAYRSVVRISNQRHFFAFNLEASLSQKPDFH